MKGSLKMIAKKVVEVIGIVAITLMVNNSIVSNTKRVEPKEPLQIENSVKKELTIKELNELKEVVKNAIKDSDLTIEKSYTNDIGNYIVDLSNGSYVVYSVAMKELGFQPIELGDWDYTFYNTRDLENCIATYASSIAPKKNVSIAKENWINKKDDENKGLKGNVVVEDKNKTLEISSDAYEEIEEGENSDLDGDIYIEDEDIVSNSNKGYTKEDYDKYTQYRDSLINEHGEEIYNLMNQEAGINTEEDSFNHYMEYGI